jgi:hypothetical protein
MPKFHFHIRENGNLYEDEEGRVLADKAAVRREAVETGASIAREVFVSGSARDVVVDVRHADAPYLKVSISMVVEDDFGSACSK